MICFYVDLNPTRIILGIGELHYSSNSVSIPRQYFQNEMYVHFLRCLIDISQPSVQRLLDSFILVGVLYHLGGLLVGVSIEFQKYTCEPSLPVHFFLLYLSSAFLRDQSLDVFFLAMSTSLQLSSSPMTLMPALY